MCRGESDEESLYRELREEIGLSRNDVAVAAEGILDAFHGHRVSALTITRITVGTGD